MGIPVMVIGESGSGKSTSLRNFKAGEIGIINVSKKPLPFRTDIKAVPTDNYAQIMDILRRAKTPSIAVDDASYLMVNEYMRTAKVTGYGKFTDMALNLWTLVTLVNEELPPERIVYFLGHLENDGTKEKFKTIGKLIDEKVTLEGMFTVVLKTVVADGQYTFATQTNGADTCKSPMGMFKDMYIPNDLKAVDDAIRDFYGIREDKNAMKKEK